VQKEVNPPSLEHAVRLVHRRWSVPVIARLSSEGPQRFTDLARWLESASRDTLVETLNDLQGAGVILRDKGGRYTLVATAAGIGPAAREAVAVVTSEEIGRLALKKWPMLVLVAVGRGVRRFNDVKAALPGLGSGALAAALKDLEAAGLVSRTVDKAYPPVVSYGLTRTGRDVFPAMDGLCLAAAGAIAYSGVAEYSP
jgi:DNA-binding HxlR family transcriptional regulator